MAPVCVCYMFFSALQQFLYSLVFMFLHFRDRPFYSLVNYFFVVICSFEWYHLAPAAILVATFIVVCSIYLLTFHTSRPYVMVVTIITLTGLIWFYGDSLPFLLISRYSFSISYLVFLFTSAVFFLKVVFRSKVTPRHFISLFH